MFEESNNLPVQKVLEGELEPSSSNTSIDENYEQGYQDGMRQGLFIGFSKAVEDIIRVLPLLIQEEIKKTPIIKEALSDGLRCGSSKSGKALVEIYRYGKTMKKLN